MKILPHLDKYPGFKRLSLKTYMLVMRLIPTKAFPNLCKGTYFAGRGMKREQYREFLRGAEIWGEGVLKMTDTNLVLSNEIHPPETGHFIFLNHVNEMDFPFDSMIIRRPYLANQAIKQTVFAYWWMRAMGSQVFDNRQSRTMVESIKNVMAGLTDSSCIVYPEGHNTYGETIKPLKKGMIKLAYDNKIPIYLALKSGIATFQEAQENNTVLYRYCGTFQPEDYKKWEDLRDAVQKVMVREKESLDRERDERIRELANRQHSQMERAAGARADTSGVAVE